MSIPDGGSKHFDNATCVAYLERVRWRCIPNCPYCGSTRCTRLPDLGRHRCNVCHTSFGVTVGTMLHGTHVPLHKWFLASELFVRLGWGITVRELAAALNVNKNTAHSMKERMRTAMHHPRDRELLRAMLAFPHIPGPSD